MPDTPLNPAVVWNLRALADEGTRELRHVVLEPDLLHKLLDIAEAVAQPEVRTVEELDALPDGAVVQTQEGFGGISGNILPIAVKQPHGWDAGWDWECGLKAEEIVPARVLYRPEVKP